MNAYKLKQEIRKKIVASCNTAKRVNIQKIVSRISLETGATHKLISQIIGDLRIVGIIKVENNEISINTRK